MDRISQNTKFKEYYDAHFHQVHHFFKNRIGQEEDAKDLTHDVFVKVLQHFQKVNAANDPDAYLFTIARNVLMDFYKKSLAHQQAIQQLKNSPQYSQPTESESIHKAEHLQRLHQSIEALPEQRKEIIKRKKLQGHSSQEIADELQLSKRTVENQLYRAMLTLRKQIAQILSSVL